MTRRIVPRKPILFIALVLLLYVGSYVAFRESRKEVWERDGRVYVIFPRGNPVLYYLYRPLTYVDGAITGMRFHIGPHRGIDRPGAKPETVASEYA